MSHYVTFHTHITILQLKSGRVTENTQTVLNILSYWTETTEVRNRSRRGRPFSRELAVGRRDRLPISWLWQPVFGFRFATRPCRV